MAVLDQPGAEIPSEADGPVAEAATHHKRCHGDLLQRVEDGIEKTDSQKFAADGVEVGVLQNDMAIGPERTACRTGVVTMMSDIVDTSVILHSKINLVHTKGRPYKSLSAVGKDTGDYLTRNSPQSRVLARSLAAKRQPHVW